MLLPYYISGNLISLKSIKNFALFTTDITTEIVLFSVSTVTNKNSFMANSK